jgi:hypothetical protein
MIPNKQIGWSEKANLLWEISRQLDRINSVVCTGPCPTTTSTTTTVNLCYCYTITNLGGFNLPCSYTNCNGEPVPEFTVTAGASESFCALFDSVFFNSQIIDNGICGLDCPPL